jgi:hypothetical protein
VPVDRPEANVAFTPNHVSRAPERGEHSSAHAPGHANNLETEQAGSRAAVD